MKGGEGAGTRVEEGRGTNRESERRHMCLIVASSKVDPDPCPSRISECIASKVNEPSRGNRQQEKRRMCKKKEGEQLPMDEQDKKINKG